MVGFFLGRSGLAKMESKQCELSTVWKEQKISNGKSRVNGNLSQWVLLKNKIRHCFINPLRLRAAVTGCLSQLQLNQQLRILRTKSWSISVN